MRLSILFALFAACGGKVQPVASSASSARDPVGGGGVVDAAVPSDGAAVCQREPKRPWPVPATGQVDFLCDLPDRVVTVIADSVDEQQVHGTARSVDRARGKVTTASLLTASDGCTGMMKCHYATAQTGMKRLWVETDARMPTWGQVGDTDKMMVSCRRHSPSAIAICVTREHSATLDFAGCNAPDAAGSDVGFVVDVYDAQPGTLDRSGFEQSQSLPASLIAVPADGRLWVYRGPGIELSFDAGDPGGGSLRVGDGGPEPCLAFATYGAR
jgi:hypothetical protein